MSKHTPEPWTAGDRTIYGSGGDTRMTVAHTNCAGSLTMEEDRANAARIVACVNGCAGINPDAVPDLLKALEDIAQGTYGAACGIARAAIAKAKP